MDLASIIGLALGAALLLMSILISGNWEITILGAFFDVPSIFVVFGGTLAATLIATPMSKFIVAIKAAFKIFKIPSINTSDAIERIINLANVARKEGLLALENVARDMDDKFLQKGVMLVVDGTDPELVRSILDIELIYIQRRHSESRSVWELMGSLAPAWGMKGTLIGLVIMLGNLSDPDSIGPSMAIALITTFYGSIVANYLAIPIAAKLKVISADEILIKEVLIEGILSIQAGENPRIIEEKLKAFVSPSLRDNSDDAGAGE